MCVSGVKKFLFSENLACFVFLKHPFWDSPFRLITDEFITFITMSLVIKTWVLKIPLWTSHARLTNIVQKKNNNNNTIITNFISVDNLRERCMQSYTTHISWRSNSNLPCLCHLGHLNHVTNFHLIPFDWYSLMFHILYSYNSKFLCYGIGSSSIH